MRQMLAGDVFVALVHSSPFSILSQTSFVHWDISLVHETLAPSALFALVRLAPLNTNHHHHHHHQRSWCQVRSILLLFSWPTLHAVWVLCEGQKQLGLWKSLKHVGLFNCDTGITEHTPAKLHHIYMYMGASCLAGMNNWPAFGRTVLCKARRMWEATCGQPV